jgi:hypothetical protein
MTTAAIFINIIGFLLSLAMLIYILYFFRRDFLHQQIADNVFKREKLCTEPILGEEPRYWGPYRQISESPETQAIRQKLMAKLALEQTVLSGQPSTIKPPKQKNAYDQH